MKRNKSHFLTVAILLISAIIFFVFGGVAQERLVSKGRDSVKVKEPTKVKEPMKPRERMMMKQPIKQKEPIKGQEPVHVKEPVRAKEPIRAKRPVKTQPKNTALHSPSPLSPSSGSSFNNYPRTTELKWRAVNGAASYMVEDEYNDGKWEPFIKQSAGNTTSYKFDFVGMQTGRWRVWAVGQDGKEGPKSSWWGFKYTK